MSISVGETGLSWTTYIPSTVDKNWWHVNKSGFPIHGGTWEKMWDYVVAAHPNGEEVALEIRGKVHKKTPRIPSYPILCASHSQDSLRRIQQYMQQLQYNYTGTQFFNINKNRPLSRCAPCTALALPQSLPKAVVAI